MDGILGTENNSQTDVSENRRLEIPGEQAKITGLVCIGCAVTAVLFAFLGSILFYDLSFAAVTFCFIFIHLSAAFGLFGYSEIKAIGRGWTSSLFMLLAVALLLVSGLSVPGKTGNVQFGVLYGLCAIFIPVVLTILTLITNKTALWKAFIPLAVSFSFIFVLPVIGTADFLIGTSLSSLSWGLLGMVAYQGRK